jgi:hypothetical protein
MPGTGFLLISSWEEVYFFIRYMPDVVVKTSSLMRIIKKIFARLLFVITSLVAITGQLIIDSDMRRISKV